MIFCVGFGCLPQTLADKDAWNAGNCIPTSFASTSSSSRSQSLRTGHHKKFLSRSHNSLLVVSPPDYSKVESKVKKYIDSMRQQQQQRRRQQNANPLVPGPDVGIVNGHQHPLEDGQQHCHVEMLQQMAHLKRQLADQEAKVKVLQENHDHLLLENARLLNTMDEMRVKIRQLPPITLPSHHQPMDHDLSSDESLITSSISSSYRELPAFAEKSDTDDTVGSCDSNLNFVCRQVDQRSLVDGEPHLRYKTWSE